MLARIRSMDGDERGFAAGGLLGLRALLLTGMLLAIPAGLVAQEDPGPPEPSDPAAATIEKALERARSDLAEKEAEYARAIEELGEQVRQEQETLEKLRDQEREALAELRKLDEEMFQVDTESHEVGRKLSSTRDREESLRREIYSQATAFKSRFEKTLLAAETPENLEEIDRLIRQEGDSTDEDLEALLRIYGETLRLAGQVSRLTVPVRLPGGKGEVQEVRALRLGLIAGLYSNPSRGDAGFISTDTEGDGGFFATSDGLSALQKSQIASLVEEPADGGLLPIDVTGGAGLATLQSRYTVSQWLELGGVFMWPLIVIAALGLLMSLERAVALALLSRGIRRVTSRVVEFVQAGRFDAAEEVCKRTGGAIGAVLHSALVHRGQPRAVLEDAVQESLLHESPRFHTRLGFIALCAAVAPLMGLLGTVTGMISTFKMVTLFGTSDPRFMAGGISEALITTQGGLFVAIPCLLLRGILGSAAASAVGKLEAGAISVVIAILKKMHPDEDDAGDESLELEDDGEEVGAASSSEGIQMEAGSGFDLGDDDLRDFEPLDEFEDGDPEAPSLGESPEEGREIR